VDLRFSKGHNCTQALREAQPLNDFARPWVLLRACVDVDAGRGPDPEVAKWFPRRGLQDAGGRLYNEAHGRLGARLAE